jgi:hypothetical protein
VKGVKIGIKNNDDEVNNMKKKTGTIRTKSSVSSVRVLDLFLWHPILVLVPGVLGFVEKGAASLVRQLGWRCLESFCFVGVFFCFP